MIRHDDLLNVDVAGGHHTSKVFTESPEDNEGYSKCEGWKEGGRPQRTQFP